MTEQSKYTVEFVPPHINIGKGDGEYDEANKNAMQVAFNLGMAQVDNILHGDYIIKCTPEQFAIFLIIRSQDVPINRFRELEAVLIPIKSNDPIWNTTQRGSCHDAITEGPSR